MSDAVRFEDLFPVNEAPEEAEPWARPVQPEWLGPPAGELGGVVPLGLVLARSELGVVALSHAIAYSTGVAFDLVAQAGGLTPRSAQGSSTTSTPGGSAATSCPRASCGSGSSFPTGRGSRTSARNGRTFARPTALRARS